MLRIYSGESGITAEFDEKQAYIYSGIVDESVEVIFELPEGVEMTVGDQTYVGTGEEGGTKVVVKLKVKDELAT